MRSHCYFNTSYVTVQLFVLIFLFYLTYYFNTSYVTVQLLQPAAKQTGKLLFQYILCYGSTAGSPLLLRQM